MTEKPPSDEFIATAYWSENIRPTLGDLPIPGLRHLRDRYILDVQDNPAALAELREWWLSSLQQNVPESAP